MVVFCVLDNAKVNCKYLSYSKITDKILIRRGSYKKGSGVMDYPKADSYTELEDFSFQSTPSLFSNQATGEVLCNGRICNGTTIPLLDFNPFRINWNNEIQYTYTLHSTGG